MKQPKAIRSRVHGLGPCFFRREGLVDLTLTMITHTLDSINGLMRINAYGNMQYDKCFYYGITVKIVVTVMDLILYRHLRKMDHFIVRKIYT